MSSSVKHMWILAVAAILVISPKINSQHLSPGLAEVDARYRMAKQADSAIDVVIFMEDFEAREAVYKVSQSRGLNRAERARSVLSELQAYRTPNRTPIMNYVQAHAKSAIVEHWLSSSLRVTMPLSALSRLADMDGVKLVVENATLVYEPPVEISSALATTSTGISSQLALLKVPELWKQGLKGKGRLVCSFDTGVEYTHPALDDRWRGNHTSLSTAWFSKVAPDEMPYDLLGHGTHTMGIMVGAAEADSFGVAPEAEWITAGVVDQGRTLSMTLSDIIEAFQWALDPDRDPNTVTDMPDVILNSWGVPKGLFSPCDDTFWGIMDHVEAAGIVAIFSAGNEGPDPMTLRNPADRATSPINSFAVGAVDDTKTITAFSSRGPSSCDTTQIKPEVVAPGVAIRSSHLDGSYVFMTGTSMAAPYIAGLVALVRQYNPNATVEEIKYAFIQAAEDLGPAGNDNAYGHGFVDASRVLDFIPAPSLEGLRITDCQISGDGVALPGESFGIRLVLSDPETELGGLTGTLTTDVDGVIINWGTAEFDLADNLATAVNPVPFDITFDSAMYHGQQVGFGLALSYPGIGLYETLTFAITVGYAPAGDVGSHENSRIALSVSDFGQYGLAYGSIYNADGDGFRFDDSENLLYEAGLVIAADSTRIARSIRDEFGLFRPSDFYPAAGLSDTWVASDGSMRRSCAFNDGSGQVPVTINQETIVYDNYDEAGFVLFRFTLNNNSSQRLTQLRVGFFFDFDQSALEAATYDAAKNVLYQQGQDGTVVGLVGLQNISVYRAIDNGDGKLGLSEITAFDLMCAASDDAAENVVGDAMFMVSSCRLVVDPLRSDRVSYALVAGASLDEFYTNVDRARAKFDMVIGVEGTYGSGGEDFRLYQNYPNPFNPVTNISFSLTESGEIELDVFNILGQRVITLHSGYLPAGYHEFQWDATNEQGIKVSNGVYFYRVQSRMSSVSKKMILLK